MRLVIKEKIISITGKYFIKDREGNDVFEVKGNFGIMKKFKIFDMQQNLIIQIKRKLRFMATFDFVVGDEVVCTAKRKFSLRPKYNIVGSAGEYTVSGNIFEWDYDIKKSGAVIATIMKKITLYRDSYVLDIDDESELPIVLGIAIMFDHIHHRHNNDSRR
jgi:Uncharacterized conserved protein